jgi:hypothetical protein
LAFWKELGFETRIDGPFGDGGRWVEIASPGALTSIALVSRVEGSTAGTAVSFATPDADADHAALPSARRRRRSRPDPHGRLHAADVHVPRPGRQSFRVVERP